MAAIDKIVDGAVIVLRAEWRSADGTEHVKVLSYDKDDIAVGKDGVDGTSLWKVEVRRASPLQVRFKAVSHDDFDGPDGPMGFYLNGVSRAAGNLANLVVDDSTNTVWEVTTHPINPEHVSFGCAPFGPPSEHTVGKLEYDIKGNRVCLAGGFVDFWSVNQA